MRLKDFQGFRFGKVHSSDLNLEVVSTSNRYEARTLPAPTDTTVDVPGSDGQYYFGSIYKNREITVNVAFDNVSEQIYRRIRQLFATDKLQDLVFDEEPYKTWRAKLKAKPDFKSLCFTDKETGERVYKGDGKLQFICYYPYAFGFDKYVVRAADYYMLNPPECIITESYSDKTFVKNEKGRNMGRMLPEDIKYHYNENPSDYEGGTTDTNVAQDRLRDKSHRNRENRSWEPNDKKIWKSGFPTPEQVEAGELFFDTPQGEKTIVDVRGYWDNVPEWEGTAKLLTTPTLDFEQELMYLPQYSKTDYINMELGFDSTRPMIGSRMLVYNPGDLPVDWEIRFDENKRGFWSTRGGTKFRIRRFNVERLTIGQAVDWCGMKTYEEADDEPFKYGNKYFKRRHFNRDKIVESLLAKGTEKSKIYKAEDDGRTPTDNFYTYKDLADKLQQGIIMGDKIWADGESYDDGDNSAYYYNYKKSLPLSDNGDKVAINLHLDFWKEKMGDDFYTNKGWGKAHPLHCYYVEPIPRQKLGHYIRLFYWQTIQWRGSEYVKGAYKPDSDEKIWTGEEFAYDMMSEVGTITTDDDGNATFTFDSADTPLYEFAQMFFELGGEDNLSIVGNKTEYRVIYENLDYEEGIALAERYEEMLEQCITEEEEFELYWDTLHILLNKFEPMFKRINEVESTDSSWTSIPAETNLEKFIDSYINHPLEFIQDDLRDLDYDNVVFNGYKLPGWITPDYVEIDQTALSGVATITSYLTAIGKDPDAIFTGKRLRYEADDRKKLIESGNYSKLIRTLDNTIGVNGYLNDLLDDYYYLNTDSRMLYTTANPYGAEFVYKPNKVIMNEAITQGHWFKIPPGWSLISIEPVVDERLWGGKRWEDGRPYDWGYGGDLNRNKREVQQLYDFVYGLAEDEFLKVYSPETIFDNIIPTDNIEDFTLESKLEYSYDGTETNKGELLKFEVWYENQNNFWKDKTGEEYNYFAKQLYKKYKTDGEYDFLKIINSIWNLISPYFKWTSLKGVYIDPDNNTKPQLDDFDVTGLPLRCINADISDWWWYACNYIWANFPPLYWACADMLNSIKIKYTPLFY